MKRFFEGLFDYNRMVNAKIIDVFLNHQDDILQRTKDLTAHIQLVHQSWNGRMNLENGLNNFWDWINPAELKKQNDQNNETSLNIIKNADLLQPFSYKNSKGDEFQNTYADVLFHLINHSSYHRGQINAGFRSVGIDPVITEYIFYKR